MAETPEVTRWWKRSRVWRRIGSGAAMFSVASTAAVLSWGHIVHTVVTYGYQGTLAGYLYPVSIDGMMIVGVTKAADNRADGRRVGFWPRLCTWAGGLQSIAAQVLSAWPYGPIAWVIAVVPSSSLIIVVETMSRRSKKDPRAVSVDLQTPVPQAPPVVAVAVATPEAPAPVTTAPVPSPAVTTLATAPKPRARRKAPRTSPRGPVQSTRKGEAAKVTDDGQEATVAPAMAEPTVIMFSDPPAATPGSARVATDSPDDVEAMVAS